VLVRLSRVKADVLRDLLHASWKFVSANATRKRRPLSRKQRWISIGVGSWLSSEAPSPQLLGRVSFSNGDHRTGTQRQVGGRAAPRDRPV